MEEKKLLKSAAQNALNGLIENGYEYPNQLVAAVREYIQDLESQLSTLQAERGIVLGEGRLDNSEEGMRNKPRHKFGTPSTGKCLKCGIPGALIKKGEWCGYHAQQNRPYTQSDLDAAVEKAARAAFEAARKAHEADTGFPDFEHDYQTYDDYKRSKGRGR